MRIWLLFILSLFNGQYVLSQNWYQLQKLFPDSSYTNQKFGSEVRLGTNDVLVAAKEDKTDSVNLFPLIDAGAVYVFKRDAADTLIISQKVVPDNRLAGTQFGSAMDLDGDFTVVGSLTNDIVYVFKRQNNGKWVKHQRLFPNGVATPATTNTGFGVSVSIKRNFIAVGQVSATSTDTVHIFERDLITDTWIHKQNLQAPYKDFGREVELTEKDLIVLGYSYVWMFRRNTVGQWVLNDTLFKTRDYVAADTNWLILTNCSANSHRGMAEFYKKDSIGNWEYWQKVEAFDSHSQQKFGSKPAIHKNHAVIGAYKESRNFESNKYKQFAGAAYVLKLDSNYIFNSGNKKMSWLSHRKLHALDRKPGENFGGAQDIKDGLVLAGLQRDILYESGNILSKAGSAYLFEFCKGLSSIVIDTTICLGKKVFTDEGWVGESGKYIRSETIDTVCDRSYIINLVIDGKDFPIVQKNGTVLSVPSIYQSYQWIDNRYGDPVSGATAPTFKPAVYGAYKVRVETNSGCTFTSDPEWVYPLGISTRVEDGMVLYPNPSKGDFNIELPPGSSANQVLVITDLSGRVVYEKVLYHLKDKIHINQPSGLYTVKVLGEGMVYHHKLLLN